MKIGLVLPVLNNFEQAIDFLYSVKTFKNELKIYIQPQYRERIPLSAARNNGLKQAIQDGCDFVIFSHDDILFAPWTLDHWVEMATSVNPDTVLMAPRSARHLFENPGSIIHAKEIAGELRDDEGLFCCFMIRPDFVDKIGWFDENFKPCWYEDNDTLYRIDLLGFGTERLDVPFIHLGSQTTKKLTGKNNQSRSRNYYRKKWGSTHRNGKEEFSTPYNDPHLTARDWIPDAVLWPTENHYLTDPAVVADPKVAFKRRLVNYLKRRIRF